MYEFNPVQFLNTLSISEIFGVLVNNPEGISFAMYSSDQYYAPEGGYEKVTAADGTQWYKQYAQDTIIQHPYKHSDGYIDRGEAIEKRMPKPPSRKDR